MIFLLSQKVPCFGKGWLPLGKCSKTPERNFSMTGAFERFPYWGSGSNDYGVTYGSGSSLYGLIVVD